FLVARGLVDTRRRGRPCRLRPSVLPRHHGDGAAVGLRAPGLSLHLAPTHRATGHARRDLVGGRADRHGDARHPRPLPRGTLHALRRAAAGAHARASAPSAVSAGGRGDRATVPVPARRSGAPTAGRSPHRPVLAGSGRRDLLAGARAGGATLIRARRSSSTSTIEAATCHRWARSL